MEVAKRLKEIEENLVTQLTNIKNSDIFIQ
jgi:hypothetical protein